MSDNWHQGACQSDDWHTVLPSLQIAGTVGQLQRPDKNCIESMVLVSVHIVPVQSLFSATDQLYWLSVNRTFYFIDQSNHSATGIA